MNESTNPSTAPRSLEAAERGALARVRVIEPRRPGATSALAELWRYRRFMAYFGRRLLAKRYARTWLGLMWLPLRPVMNVTARLLVFGGIIGITAGEIPYPIFFLLATAAWTLFSECAIGATRSLDVNRRLLLDVHIPRLVVICSALLPSLVEFLMAITIGGVAVLYYFYADDTFYLHFTLWSPLVILAAITLIALLGVGVGLVTASASARARDVRFAIGYFLNFLYFLTPVIYPFDVIPDRYKPVAELNPLTGAIELFKAGVFPNEAVSPEALIVTTFFVLALWVPGLWLYQRNEARDW